MRSIGIILTIAAMCFTAGSMAYADISWSFNIVPVSAEAGPGGTMQWNYDVTNDASSSESLNLIAAGAAWIPPFPLIHMDEAALDLDVSTITPIPPGTGSSGPFYHIKWKDTAPLGLTVNGGMFLAISNVGARPPQGFTIPVNGTVTPELPPGALGLLGFVPFGIWRMKTRFRLSRCKA